MAEGFHCSFNTSLKAGKFVRVFLAFGKKVRVFFDFQKSYCIFFGTDEFRNNPYKKPIVGEIIYQDTHSTYRNSFNIDFEKYATFFSVNTTADDLHSDMKKLTQELRNISQTLKTRQHSKQYDNNEN